MKRFIEGAQKLSFVVIFGYGMSLVLLHMAKNIQEVCPW